MEAEVDQHSKAAQSGRRYCGLCSIETDELRPKPCANAASNRDQNSDSEEVEVVLVVSAYAM